MSTPTPRQPKITFGALVFWLLIGTIIGWQSNTIFASPDELAAADEITQEQEESITQEDSENSQEISQDPENEIEMDQFWEIWGLISDDYFEIDEVEDQDRIYGAISGMMSSLGDPYSAFMDPKITEEFHIHLSGELEGIGAELIAREGLLTVVSPIKSSPAERAGLLPGDYIYLVEGEPTSEMTLWEAIMLIRGEKGTDVTLTLVRAGIEEPFEVTITRDEIEVPSIELEIFEEGEFTLAHMRMYQFGDDTHNEFKEAIQQMSLQGVDGLILDLRFNGGGFLDESVDILGEFFEEEVKAVVTKRRGDSDDIMFTPGRGNIADLPAVVLINEGSASASEIVAGALQDYARATIIGTQSFGKGSVQELTSLSDGSSIRLTVAKWFTPELRGIDEIGITPDLVVEMSLESAAQALNASDLSTEEVPEDIQLKAAIESLLSEF
jgi:carboxyl-terminal processing protease